MHGGPSGGILEAFGLGRADLSSTTTGHIHQTFVAVLASERWVLQQINLDVMGDPWPLMRNALLTAECVSQDGGVSLEYRRARGRLMPHTRSVPASELSTPP